MKNQFIVILGPTASGKTKLAVSLAGQIDGEIISADSRQVYRGMDIGTGKDLEEYATIRHHLIDIVEAGEDYNVAFFQRDFKKAFDEIISRNKIPILCGGTGMYIDAVLRNHEFTQVPINQVLRDKLEGFSVENLTHLFKEKYQIFYPKADISTRKRLIRAIEIGEFIRKNGNFKLDNIIFENQNFTIFGINPPTEIRRERISKRLDFRLKNGMIEEVEGLLKKGISPEKLIFYGLEYKLITEYLIGKMTYHAMTQKLEIAIHQFAKRQMTFFRSMEHKGLKIKWLDGELETRLLLNQIIHDLKR